MDGDRSRTSSFQDSIALSPFNPAAVDYGHAHPRNLVMLHAVCNAHLHDALTLDNACRQQTILNSCSLLARIQGRILLLAECTGTAEQSEQQKNKALGSESEH